MGLTISQKIIKEHLVSGEMIKGSEIGLKIDRTLTQDATGTMAYLQYIAMGVPRVKTEFSIAYIDHNTLQSGFENADDHRFIQTACYKHGIRFSRPGNGICHQVNLERFAIPGKTLIGSDSHTPTAGGIGMLAMGAGGLDVAIAMGGGTYYIPCPKIVNVNLIGKLRAGVSAKDIILEVLRIMTVKGGVGKIIEYGGEALSTLSVPERATITNMGAELGATTSIFPSDERTLEFLTAQGRAEDWTEIKADDDAEYDEYIDINLSELEPLIAMPHMPDRVVKVSEIEGLKIDQVCIGSCTNSSLYDMMKTAAILKNKTVAPNVSLTISPGSKQVLNMIALNGGLADMIDAGARILESTCGPCIGMGQSPVSAGVSLRTFNRNFLGRSGTKDASVYLVSPETAAASAICGVLTNPMKFADVLEETTVKYSYPKSFLINDNMVVEPCDIADYDKVEVVYGPNIKEVPIGHALEETLTCTVGLKVGDDITTDHIMPAGAKILPYRSNVPHLSKFCFEVVDETYSARAKELGNSFIVGGANYGQGSSREHAALVPLYLGVRAVIAVSFARMHKANLINSGIIPLEFVNADDYNDIEQGDVLTLENIRAAVENETTAYVVNVTKNKRYAVSTDFSDRQRKMLLCGGALRMQNAE
ncbi:MAG TPA: aconitate hydratase [Clostridiales bacterium]|nr:aconitate hydratase [Clostridiales bacterium]